MAAFERRIGGKYQHRRRKPLRADCCLSIRDGNRRTLIGCQRPDATGIGVVPSTRNSLATTAWRSGGMLRRRMSVICPRSCNTFSTGTEFRDSIASRAVSPRALATTNFGTVSTTYAELAGMAPQSSRSFKTVRSIASSRRSSRAGSCRYCSTASCNCGKKRATSSSWRRP